MARTNVYNHRTQATILVGAGLLVLFALGMRFSSDLVTWIAVAVILLAGFPHGADDMAILRRLGYRSRAEQAFVFTAYIVAILATLLLWYVAPIAGLVCFVLLSILHFGQDHVEQLNLKTNRSTFYAGTWGIYVLLAPLSWRPAEVQPVIEAMVQTSLSENLLLYVGVFAALSGIVTLLHAGYRYTKDRNTSWLAEIVLLLLLGHVYLMFPSIWGFAFFFVSVHATTSLLNQFQMMGTGLQRVSAKRMLLRSAPYAFAAVGAIPLILFGSQGNVLNAEWLAGFFILISAFTTPHAIVMHQALRLLRNQSSPHLA